MSRERSVSIVIVLLLIVFADLENNIVVIVEEVGPLEVGLL